MTDSLDWRGKPVRELTPDEMQQFAIWALREITRLRQERDAYLDRAVAKLQCAHDNYDTLAERACSRMVGALRAADAAINPPDRSGISLDIWNKRLKEATTIIRAALASSTIPVMADQPAISPMVAKAMRRFKLALERRRMKEREMDLGDKFDRLTREDE